MVRGVPLEELARTESAIFLKQTYTKIYENKDFGVKFFGHEGWVGLGRFERVSGNFGKT